MKTEIVSTKKKTSIGQAAKILLQGGVVAYPTETSYALGCDATSSRAIRKIFKLKKREKNKALPVIVGSLKTIVKYALLSKGAIALAEWFMPGPLTLVVEVKKGALPPSLGGDGVAFRISSNSFARALATKLGRPIVSTSANRSGEPSIYSGKQLIEHYDGKVELIAQAGELKPVRASTIIDLRGDAPALLRQGPVAFASVLKELKKCER